MKIKQTLYIEEETAKLLKHHAIDIGKPIGETVEVIILDYLKQHKGRTK